MPVITPGSTTVGAVQISGLSPSGTPIETWANALLLGKGYGMIASQAPVAAQRSYVELRNPLGSGKNLWVYYWSAYPGAANQLVIGRQSPPNLAAGSNGVNLLTGAGDSVARINSSTNAAVLSINFAFFYAAANQQVTQVQPWVIVIAPNSSLVVTNYGLNDFLTVNFGWMEV